MPGDNGFRSRQANAIAAGGAGAGGICPVEAVKVPGELGCVHPHTGIRYGNADIPSPHGYRQMDHSRRVAVFDCIIQQNRKQAEEIILDAF